jgi:hypothetical protein
MGSAQVSIDLWQEEVYTMTPTGDFPPRRVLCVGAVVLHDDFFIMVRQIYGSLKGKWSIPWGFVDAGEPLAGHASTTKSFPRVTLRAKMALPQVWC